MHRNKNHIGRVRISAAKVLTACLGFEVYPEDILPASGANRTNRMLDIYCWELFARDRRFSSEGIPVVVGCYERLTDFIKEAKKHGCHIDRGELVSGRKTNG